MVDRPAREQAARSGSLFRAGSVRRLAQDALAADDQLALLDGDLDGVTFLDLLVVCRINKGQRQNTLLLQVRFDGDDITPNWFFFRNGLDAWKWLRKWRSRPQARQFHQ